MLCIWLHTFTDLCMLCIWLHTVTGICIQWPNLKNLSGGLNLSRGLNMVGSTYQIVSNVSRFKPALNLNWVLADLNRGSNSLNSISGPSISERTKLKVKKMRNGVDESGLT